MLLKEKLQADVKEALKAGNSQKRTLLGMVLAAVKNREFDKRAKLSKSHSTPSISSGQAGSGQATDFVFTGHEYPSMGMFVDSINGKKNTGGYYWIFYVNGKSSQYGISSAVVHPGDTIEWKYERGY